MRTCFQKSYKLSFYKPHQKKKPTKKKKKVIFLLIAQLQNYINIFSHHRNDLILIKEKVNSKATS